MSPWLRPIRVGFLTALLLAAAPAARAESAQALARKGNEYYKQERLQEAIDSYRDAIARDPDSPLIEYNLGTALARAERHDEAGQVLQQAAQSPSRYRGDAWFNLGVDRADRALKQHPQLRQCLQSQPGASAPIPQQTSATVDPRAIEETISQLQNALQAFRQSIIHLPNNDEAKYNYEVIHQMIERLKELQRQQQQQQQQKDQQQQQNQQNQQQQQKDQEQQEQQQQQQQKGGLEHQNTAPQNEQGGEPQPSADDGQAKQPLAPDQMNAMRLLQLLESQQPEQFKKLFKLEGKPRERQPTKDW